MTAEHGGSAFFSSNETTPRISQDTRSAPRDALKSQDPHAAADHERNDKPSDDDRDPEKNDQDAESTPDQQQAQAPPEKDPSLVEWDGPDDPEHPQNLPRWRKWVITISMALMTTWVTFSSSVFSTATRVTAKQFDVGTEVTILGTSLVIFGFAVGPQIWSPLSELYGRRIPLFFGYAVFAIFQIPVAVAQNLRTILVCRFFIGVFGCSPLAVVGGAMADIWGPIDRAVAIAMFAGATFLGPSLGPIIGGFITQSYLGWRWTAWITLIAAAFFGLIALFVIPETYSPVLLQKRAARLRRETRNWALHSALDENRPTASEIGRKYLLRPMMMLIFEPILLLITLYLSLIYGILYLFFEAYPVSFMEVRGWTNLGIAGLPFIGILVGVIFGILLIIWQTKTRFARKLQKHGKVVPEERLVPMMMASIMLPAGLFWFGWTSDPNIHWAPQVIAGVPIGAGILVIFMQGLNYIIDVYMMFANSAIAANTLIRSLIGGAFPLFAVQMYHRLGVAWASSLLGFLSVAMIPIPILFFFYGAKIRAMSKYTPKL